MSERWSYIHKLRKYRKRLRRGWVDGLSLLAWRYHFKVHGGHASLWEESA